MLVFALDPGVSSGAAVLSVENEAPAVLVAGFQRPGGVTGLIELVKDLRPFGHGVWACEKFTARATKGFSYTTASLEPLRGEGALIALGRMPDYTVAEKRWRDPKHQYLVGGKDLPDKKARMHRFLKESGFYLTNKDFPDSPSKDQADDFRSACAHGIAYVSRELKHKPTFDMISEWTEKNG